MSTPRLGERLLQAGLITREALAQALEFQKRSGSRVGEALVELKLLSEAALLRFLAAEWGTRYVSADKLAKVKVETVVLDRIPVRMAEKMAVLPIAFEPNSKTLSVVMADTQNIELLTELKVLAGADNITSFIALKAAVQAGVKKFYYGDPSAFALLDTPAADQRAQVGALGSALESSGSSRPGSKDLPMSASRDGTIAKMAQGDRGLTGVSNPGSPAGSTSVRRAMEVIQRTSLMSDNDYAETLHVLVGLLEMAGPRKGHSTRIAKQSRLMALRLGLSQRDVSHIVIAAYLHEVGKGEEHLTLLSAAMSEEKKALAKRQSRVPLKLFESVHLPSQVATVIAQLFEAFDGSGTPQGVKGEEIALGARILAAADSFEDLVSNPDNPFGAVLSRSEALEKIEERSGKLFDPQVVEVLRSLATGELLRQRLQSEGHQVLLAEPDEAVRKELTRALTQFGLLVTAVPNSELAFHQAVLGEGDLLVASTSLQPDDAFVLTGELRKEPLTAGLPVLLLASRDEPQTRDRAGQLGIAGILLTPVDTEQLSVQCKELLDARVAAGAPHRAVQGSIEELPLADLLRICASTQRSGQIALRTDAAKGEIGLERGRIVQAMYGAAKGESALKQLFELAEGDFRLDPNFLVLEQQIDLDVEAAIRGMAPRH